MNLAEKVTLYKGQCLEIVEKYIENKPFNEQDLLDECCLITQAHFDDIVEERACSNICGYVLCNNALSTKTPVAFKSRQTYRIKDNTVYDITRRRNVCSDLCYMRAHYLRNQLSCEPLYMRQSPITPPRLYTEERGLAGDQVKISETTNEHKCPPSENKLARQFNKDQLMTKNTELTKRNILRQEKRVDDKLGSPYLEDNTFKELKDKYAKLSLCEKNVITERPTQQTDCSTLNGQLSEQVPPIDADSVHFDQTDRDACDDYVAISSAKLQNQSILDESISNTPFIASNQSKVVQLKGKKIFMDSLAKISQWITNSTRTLLKVPLQADSSMHDAPVNGSLDEDPQAKIAKYRLEYYRLCAKLHSEEVEDQKYDEVILRQTSSTNKNNNKSNKKSLLKEPKTQSSKNNLLESQAELEKVASFFSGQFYIEKTGESNEKDNTDNKEKRVRFQEPCKEGDDNDQQLNEQSSQQSDPDPTERSLQPLTIGPHAKRKQVFLSEMQAILEEVFDSQMDPSEICIILDGFKSLIATFHLTAQNMVLGKKHNLLVCVLLLRIVIHYGLIDKNDDLFNSNIFIVQILSKFQLTTDFIDNNLEQIFYASNNSNMSFINSSVHD